MAAAKSTEPRAGYSHGTSASEQDRLAALDHLSNEQFVGFLDARFARLVLEVGSGLGILAARVAEAAPEATVVGLERSGEQLARADTSFAKTSAKTSRRARFVRGDAHQLPFARERFDIAYCRYLLEHVSDPSLVPRTRIQQAIADLEALRKRDDASGIFYWNRATGRK